MGRRRSLIGGVAAFFELGSNCIHAAGLSVTLEIVPLLDFYGLPHRDVFKDDLPVRACTTAEQMPMLWATPFSRLRLRMTPDRAAQSREWHQAWKGMAAAGPEIRRTSAFRGFCAWLISMPWLCEDCRETPCAQAAGNVHDSPDYAGYLPPQGGCIYIDRLPEGSTKVQVLWEQVFDPWVFVRLVVGAALIWGWRTLRESRMAHALLGGFSSLALIAALFLWWFTRTVSGTTSVTMGRSVSALMMMLVAFIPAAREALISWVVPSSSSDWMAWLNMRDPIWGMPIGWIGAGISSLVALSIVCMGATYSMQMFASEPEPEGGIGFGIGSDGRRVDRLPAAPMQQRCLGLVSWFLGILLILQSTHSDAVSLVFAFFVLTKDRVCHAVCMRFRAASSTLTPEDLRPLVTSKAYEDQGRSHTAQALAELQSYLRANQTAVHAVREEHELRLRRFTDGAHHCPPNELECEAERSWSCCVL